MKKFALCAIFAFSMFLTGCGSGTHHLFGKLAYVTGTAQVFDAAKGSWAAAGNGAAIRTGDSLRTSKESEAVLTFGNNTIKLSENTCIVVSDSLDSDKKRLIAVLDKGGEILSEVKDVEQSGARYEVWTPTAVAHAEGTHFTVEFSPQPYVTNVRVLDGRVRVFNPFVPSAPQVYVSPGCFTRVGYNEAPVAAAPMNYGQFKKMQRVLGPKYYHDYEVRYKIRPDEMVLDAPIVVVPIGVPIFLPPPPMPLGPHGHRFFPAPFLLPPGPGMPLPHEAVRGMIAPMPPGPGMPLPHPSRGGMIAPMPPPLAPGLPPPPFSGQGRAVVRGPAGPFQEPHGEIVRGGHGGGGHDKGDRDERGGKGNDKHKDRTHKKDGRD